jgi:hypothetical protein
LVLELDFQLCLNLFLREFFQERFNFEVFGLGKGLERLEKVCHEAADRGVVGKSAVAHVVVGLDYLGNFELAVDLHRKV